MGNVKSVYDVRKGTMTIQTLFGLSRSVKVWATVERDTGGAKAQKYIKSFLGNPEDRVAPEGVVLLKQRVGPGWCICDGEKRILAIRAFLQNEWDRLTFDSLNNVNRVGFLLTELPILVYTYPKR